ncbi:MAG TPA: DUF1549 and DUF1553 domain-containing protein [Pirellulales bacterium]|nr:DUF1549 and DUF1553 domain-containing protein [Pirellulales bacterium]
MALPAHAADTSAFSAEDRDYWAWRPLVRAAVPRTTTPTANPIDGFLQERLNEAGIQPAPEADRRTLIRRATFDLHGLPPTPEEVAQFEADAAPEAFERLIDRLLASPRYGEHVARYWLDLVRYAESDGFKSDDLRENAWRYRDYVIAALNEDIGFDRFVIEQLAGDELQSDDPRALVATGYLRLGPYEENGRDVADQRSNILNDITDVTGQVFFGLTIGCARCHDHKYDPILQADYFRLQAFFAALALTDDEPLATSAERAAFAEKQAQWETATATLRDEIAALEAPNREKLMAEKRGVFPDYMQKIFDTPVGGRTPLESQMIELASRQLVVSTEDVAKCMTKEQREAHAALRRRLREEHGAPPAPLPVATLARDIGEVAPPTSIPGDDATIEPGYLSVLGPAPPQIQPIAGRSTGRRLALARWIAGQENTLTPRVMVNRVWQQHFGRGFASSADFGRQGEPPTHPALLDWLAAQWQADGMRFKSLHRLIMTSAAYRRASLDPSPEMLSADPENALYARFVRRRLTGEQLRDAILAASGELNLEMGGPSVRSELPKGISEAYAWKPDKDPAQRNRRSIYLLVRRNLREPLLEVFDMPDTHETCTRRLETTTAPQALFLLNADWSLERAAELSRRVESSESTDAQRAIRAAYRLVFQREPQPDELQSASDFLHRQTGGSGEEKSTPAGGRVGHRTLVGLCHVLLNSNEFLFVD